MGHAPETPFVIHSDAEYEPGSGRQPRVGWFFRVGNQPPLGKTLVLEQCITERWKKRTQQIFPAETVAIVIGTWSMHRHLIRRDVSWFIDLLLLGDEIPPLFMAAEQFLYVFVILDYNSLLHVHAAVSLVSFSRVHFNEVCGRWVSLVSEHSLFLILYRQVLPQSLYPDVSVVCTDNVLLHILSGRLFVSA